MKRWKILHKRKNNENILTTVLKNRNLVTDTAIQEFFNPRHPNDLRAADVGIDAKQLNNAIKRVKKAIDSQESVVVYCDYDVDGITGGTILWEVLHNLGANVMPYVPHRESEGYGFSKKGIDNAYQQFKPELIISVDHGITAADKITYAKGLGIEIIITDHHAIPDQKPSDAVAIVHTAQLSGSAVAWFFAKELVKNISKTDTFSEEYLALAAMGTIADLVPLVGVNRSIVLHGLRALNKTNRLGLQALFDETGIEKGVIEPYHIGFIIGPRINAVGRLTHALDALRLLCTKNQSRAVQLAQLLGETNMKRRKILEESLLHAFDYIGKDSKNLLFVAHESYNQGVIGLIAGRLTERFYRPAIVLAKGPEISKASARSIKGINMVQLLRSADDLLIDVGGHPMAAGFTVSTKNLAALEDKLMKQIQTELTEEMLIPEIRVDASVQLSELTLDMFHELQQLMPFGVGNPRPLLR